MDHGESPPSSAVIAEEKQLASAGTKQAPRLPQELVNEIVDYIFTDSGLVFLQSCSLISESWVSSCRRYLFHTVVFTPTLMEKWLEIFQTPERSPTHYVKVLTFSFRGYDCHGPEEFSEYTPRFANARALSILGDVQFLSLSIPLFKELPQAVTYLNIEGSVDLEEARDFMEKLPNLDDLRLSGFLTKGEVELSGLGATLRGRFRGKLKLIHEWADQSVMDMLLEAPGGIHFTELHIHPEFGCFPSTVRLAEACSENLVRLRYTVAQHICSTLNQPSFDFSKFPNLHELTFNVKWLFGFLDWIPTALSTFKPATSPLLNEVYIGFDYPLNKTYLYRDHERWELEYLSGELQWIGRELTRIEHEYEGKVNIMVIDKPKFQRLTTGDALQRWRK